MDNYYKCSGSLKEQASEVKLKCSEADVGIKTEQADFEKYQLSITYENSDIVNATNVFDDSHAYFSSSEVTNTKENCEIFAVQGPASSDADSVRAGNCEGDLAPRSAIRTYLEEIDVSGVIPAHSWCADVNAVLENHGLDSTCKNVVVDSYPTLEDKSVTKIIPHFSAGKAENSVCPVVFVTTEKIAISEATETKINKLVPFVHITLSEHEPPRAPKIAKCPARKKDVIHSMPPPNVCHSFNILAYKENDKIKNNRNKSSKTKMSSKVPREDFSVSDESSTKCHTHNTNIKNQIFPSVGLSHVESEASSKLQKKRPQTKKHHVLQSAQKSKKQAFPYICKSSSSLEKHVTPLSIPQTQSVSDFLNLKYSDMFKEINSNDKGPGIYEMFGTPVYSQARGLGHHESRFYREVCSAPPGRYTANKRKSNCTNERDSSRIRSTQKRTRSKPKNTSDIKQKHKDITPKEKCSELRDSNTELNDIIISGADWHIRTSRSMPLFNEDESQQFLFLEEFSQLTKQNEIILNSNLSVIKEVPLEQSSDNTDVANDQILATNVHNFQQVADKHNAECVALVSSLLKDASDNKCVVQGRVNMNDSINLEANQTCKSIDKCEALFASSFSDCASPQQKLDQCWPHTSEKSNSENASSQYPTNQTLNAESPVFQTYQNILDCADNEELTDELLCCLAAELLALDEKDTASSRMPTKNTGSKPQNVFAKEERGSVDEDGKVVASAEEKQSYSKAFLAPKRENDLLNFNESTAFPEIGLGNKDHITWTRGECLGKGAYGTVYCGLTSQGQLIAVKQVALDTSHKVTTEKEYQKLQEEVDLLKTLKHINIVTYLGTCLKDNTVSIFMEFVPGGSISSIINRFGPLPEIVFCKYTKQILQGVAYLHKNSVVHRDIKGNNVMLMPTGVIKLIDFGCAKRLACVSLSGTHSEMLKSVHGTPYWMAPEVINESGYGRKSDIWSIGCTVFEMAMGKPPLASMNRLAAMFYIGAHRGLMPSLPDHFSGKAVDFVQVCLTRNQRERPSALQLLQHPFMKGRQ